MPFAYPAFIPACNGEPAAECERPPVHPLQSQHLARFLPFMTTRSKSKPHPHAALPDAGSASLISDARLIEIYAAMLKCRMFREGLRLLASPAKLRSAAPGSEAVAASVTVDLLPEDRIISAAPHLLAALLKGAPLASLVASLASRAPSLQDGVEQAFSGCGVLAAPSAGAGNSSGAAAQFATGIAFAGKLAGRGHVTVVFYEDTGTVSVGREIFDFAVTHDLPMIFIRQAAAPLPPDLARNRSAAAKSLPSGLPVIPVDRNDAVAVYRVAHEAIAHARRGSGPTLIDCVPVRLPGERKQDSDCVIRMEHYLAAKGLRPERIHAKVAAKFTRALQTAAGKWRRGAGRRRSRGPKS
jgi:TPP-dependent pyruvate/acetoin dehydrogenase alpha subunit